MTDYKQLNGLALAYVGDAIYEVYIRDHLIATGRTQPKQLHHFATQYVSAKAQAFLIQQMLDEQILQEEEEKYYRRGRNSKSHTIAKNTDIKTYRMSTGFESVMGYLHLSKQTQRLDELAVWCIQKVEENSSKVKKKI
ncbi:Mini-ribonuclease 3 [Tetragenococcus muriaticus]|uniref:Mini-ribonuclease 3 n=2 Tax=Tetragenococcus muriaticus TaxID=64642 RepID=A0A091CEW7_9ENTE|nr:Mini-ribonuclease 3 [Tetragenococcus muriaticus]KFN93253.1 ribonuclease III family protein [Tetragenococcus muriaticus 3MR10-3]KFN93806.1 ribonuclease III family protein [Tetragenococcus muriaticus PMC-11-5]GMA48226.1 mini-ribonuclease 3 [Tetragenococcus muriaticus]